jgi:hypothetical protein
LGDSGAKTPIQWDGFFALRDSEKTPEVEVKKPKEPIPKI